LPANVPVGVHVLAAPAGWLEAISPPLPGSPATHSDADGQSIWPATLVSSGVTVQSPAPPVGSLDDAITVVKTSLWLADTDDEVPIAKHSDADGHETAVNCCPNDPTAWLLHAALPPVGLVELQMCPPF
jgi:hypothetical protein